MLGREAEERRELCRLPARFLPGYCCYGGHKPGIGHQGGHFYGRQLCLATAWPRYGRSILAVQYPAFARPDGGGEGTGQRAPQGYQDIAEGYCWAPEGGWMEREKELVTFLPTGSIAPIDHPLTFFPGPSVNETARLSRVPLPVVKHTTGRFVSSLFSECREIRAGGTCWRKDLPVECEERV